jgi:hypothetical protein
MPIPVAVPIALGILSQLTKGFGDKKAAEFDAAVARRNAKLARMQAASEEIYGAAEAGQVRMAGTQTLAEQQVAVGANNADLGSESALALFSTTRAMNAMDIANVRANAAKKAWGFEQEASQYDAAAKQAKRRGKSSVVDSILGSAGEFFMKR